MALQQLLSLIGILAIEGRQLLIEQTTRLPKLSDLTTQTTLLHLQVGILLLQCLSAHLKLGKTLLHRFCLGKRQSILPFKLLFFHLKLGALFF
ncbi:hypothetical protein Xvtw_13300 [Xanthomonas campestris pv. vitiswoodrowii]|nr:hypothetical protein Xvtw_13300 [Xanthomonas campestris pv. vitiswoodrowii]